ncbi:40S ribosomal protein S10 [Musa troglodytarum]|uniref:40S ribosomal protein S10 n=1 Tax=Musa troglodytarum TaxID=320322 RepID=A0A9E7E9K7_9LILI|nr:40S ribosomal protein S10 [Musa troglodytarum]
MAAEVACACAGETEEEEEARAVVGEAAAIRALNTAVELHLEKTIEKKRAVDAQKKEMWRLFQLFFLFLAVLFAAQLGAPQDRLQCRHCWVPIALVALGHLAFYAATAQTLRCIHGCKYQRRCHKLTLALATDRLKLLTTRCSTAAGRASALLPGELEIHYQKPPESYLRKFNRSWAVHVGFLICTFGFMVSSTVVIIPKKNRHEICKYLFQEGVLYAKKDYNLAKHQEIDVPNLQVIKLMQSFKSREYVRETFAWQHYYWYLTNDGIEYLRTYLNLPSEIVPATLKKSARPPARPFGSGPPGDRPRGPPRFEGDRPRFGDRDGYRGGPRPGGPPGDGGDKGGAPPEFQPSFRGTGGRPGFGRGGGGYGAGPASASFQ